MSQSNKSARLLFFIGASLVVFVGRLVSVRGLEDNEQIVDDFDTGTATYWQGLQVNDSTTFWHLSMHGEPLPPGIDVMQPPSEDGDGFIEVFPVSDSPARIFSNVFDLLPGATVEMTYWNFDAIYPSVRNAVLLLYKELKQLDDDTGLLPPLMTVLIYSAPISNDPSLGWITVPIDLQIKEPSKIQLRIDGRIANSNCTGMAVSKITIKNGLELSTSSTPTETSTVGSTTIHSTTELTTTTRTSLSSPSKSPTLIPTTIASSTMSSTLSTTTILSSSTSVSSSIPSSILSTATSTTIYSTSTPHSISSTNPTVSTSSTTSTMPPPPGASNNQLQDVLIGVGVSILLFFLFCLLFTLCYKRHRRRAYLIENRQLEAGIIRQLQQLDRNPSLPYKTVYDSPSISSTNSTETPTMSFP